MNDVNDIKMRKALTVSLYRQIGTGKSGWGWLEWVTDVAMRVPHESLQREWRRKQEWQVWRQEQKQLKQEQKTLMP